jgi:hypothetical protein
MLRIDTTQHQVHALMLVRRFMYTEAPAAQPPR